MLDISSKQRQILAGMVGAVLFAIVFLFTGYHLVTPPQVEGPGEAILFVLKWEVPLAVMLMLGIGTVARKRFFGPGIDGEPTPDLKVDRIYIENTLEQAVLAVIAHLALVAHLKPEQLGLIPLLVALWVLARILFWIGYKIAPQARAFGFALTFYPTAGALLYSLGHLS